MSSPKRPRAGARAGAVTLAVVLLLTGCAGGPQSSRSTPPQTDFDRIAAAVRAGDLSRAPELRPALLADERMNERLIEETAALTAMMQADERGEDAMPHLERALDTNYASLLAHYNAMIRADLADDAERAEFHEAVLVALFDYIGSIGDGSRESPYPIVNFDELELIKVLLDLDVIGSQITMEDHLVLVEVFVRDADARMGLRYFDLTPVISGAMSRLGRDPSGPGSAWQQQFRLEFVAALARHGISAAQATYANWALNSRHLTDLEHVVGLMEGMSPGENAVAAVALARGHAALSGLDTSDPTARRAQATDLLIDAIEAGFARAAIDLFDLSIAGWADDLAPGDVVPLVERCAVDGDAPCAFRLASMHLMGPVPNEGITRDETAGWRLLNSAAEAGHDWAVALHGEHTLGDVQASDAERAAALERLERAAARGLPNSAAMLGRLFVGGYHVARDIERGKQLWRRALAFNLDAGPVLVNEIAWALATESNLAIRDPQLAIDLMEAMLIRVPHARGRPQYIETLAAAYAAAADFERAVELQHRAVELAEAQDADEEVLTLLHRNLAAFSRGDAIRQVVF